MHKFNLFLLIFSTCYAISGTMIIDGNLDEPEWAKAFSANEFYQTSPYNLERSKDQTTVYIFSNEDGIYVGFVNNQSNLSMSSRKTLRDESSSLSDRNAINIDYSLRVIFILPKIDAFYL